MPPGGIRTSTHSKRDTANPNPRLRGHRDRSLQICSPKIYFVAEKSIPGLQIRVVTGSVVRHAQLLSGTNIQSLSSSAKRHTYRNPKAIKQDVNQDHKA